MTRIDFKLPDIGEGVAEGEITSWKVSIGDSLIEDEVMVEVMTDKATVEIGSPVTGKVVDIPVAEGDTIAVGSVIIVLADEAPDAAPAAKGAGEQPATQKTVPAVEPAAMASSGVGSMEEVEFALPDIGEGVAEGEITKWLVKEGDGVSEDQPMVEVMTDKATVEIGSPVDGMVLKLLHSEGTTVPVGEVLVLLGAGSESASSSPESVQTTQPVATPVAAATSEASGSSGGVAVAAPPAARASTLVETGLPDRADGSRRVRAAPAVRRLAREMNLDVGQLNGTGPNARVTMDDVRRAGQSGTAEHAPVAPAAPKVKAAQSSVPSPAPAAAPSPAPVPAAVSAPTPAPMQGDERVPLRGLRKRIAVQMRVAKQTAAHFAYVEEIDVTELVAARKAAKSVAEGKGVKLTYMPYIVKAACTALREFPLLNASLDEEAQEVVYHGDINMGIAVETPDGLIVPVIRQADTKTMLQVSHELAGLADRARNRKTQPADVGGGTFTITNAGNIGGLLATPIINVPEVAIMGVHAIRRRPWVVDDEIVIRDIMYLSLSLDHRVVDGAVGARFMNRVQELLENPTLMLLES
jgi:pyruvate dehydrogenase E2 component (dihydrolipoamide acetyltransferase)